MPSRIRAWLLLPLAGLAATLNGADVLPTVTEVAPVAPGIVGLTLQDRVIESRPRDPYVAAVGDRLEEREHRVPAWAPDGIALTPVETRLFRTGAAGEQPAGRVFRPRPDWSPRVWAERTVGEPFAPEAVAAPASYRITSPDDERFAGGLAPRAVNQKTKPCDGNETTGDKALQHRLYLVLPHELRDGAVYTITFPGFSPAVPPVSFTHDPRSSLAEAIHVNHLGYRPDDPFKRAFVSLWMGTGGGLKLDVDRFELIDSSTGEVAFTGSSSGVFPAARAEGFSTARNMVGADVHWLDFGEFAKPGTYRVRVPGLGVSLPFRIGDDTWSRAFRIAMHGLLSHRSGIELGPPFTDYRRPRPMHPDDGIRVFAIPYTMLEGESSIVEQGIRELLASGVPPERWETVPDAWGGYMDAGDWDRRSQHLAVSRQLVELFETNPAFFRSLRLELPPAEANDRIPDLLNEAAWTVAFYRRMQLPDGGVRGGIESTAHPIAGQASWEETLVLAAFAPDPYTTYSYAAAAAMLAQALGPYDPKDARRYAASARQAWDWAEANAARVLDEAEARTRQLPPGGRRAFQRAQAELRVREMRFVAAGAIYALTRDRESHRMLRDLSAGSGTGFEALGTLFRYARLPADRTDPVLRNEAVSRVCRQAEIALEFGRANAFGLHTHTPEVPLMGYVGFYSVPEMTNGPVLPRAWLLTGDERYLRGALHAAHYSAGANPLNMTFTTGAGHRWPRHPLHLDSRVTGQPAPRGITIYGPMDAAADFPFNQWAHRWHLQDMQPASRIWPAAEWHIDFFRWPAMSEYTVHQTFRPTAYYWGFLAARGLRP